MIEADRTFPAFSRSHRDMRDDSRPPIPLPRSALAATRFCDHAHPAVRAVVSELVAGAGDSGELAIAVSAFEFVRDQVLYTLGPWGVPASSTLERRAGMCTNKANLLVALFRAAGIPAAYGVLRVNARDYFGVLGPGFLTGFISRESTHVYAAAFLCGRWVKCDPSTDREMAGRTAHFCSQTKLIEWDGARDSLDFLDPRHVYADLGLHPDIAEVFEKPPRGATPERFAIWNDYIEFIRREPPFHSSEELIAAYRSTPAGKALLATLEEIPKDSHLGVD